MLRCLTLDAPPFPSWTLYQYRLIFAEKIDMRVTQNNGWVLARDSGDGYKAYWHERDKGRYMIAKTASTVTTYYIAQNTDVAEAVTEFGTAWTGRAGLTYKEYTELL